MRHSYKMSEEDLCYFSYLAYGYAILALSTR